MKKKTSESLIDAVLDTFEHLQESGQVDDVFITYRVKDEIRTHISGGLDFLLEVTKVVNEFAIEEFNELVSDEEE